MAKNLFFLTLSILPVALATEAVHEFYNLDALKNLTDAGNKKILEISNILDETPKGYRDLIAERFDCLQWECVCQQKSVNKSTSNAVIKGLLKNSKLASFQCISNSSSETLDKLKAASSNLSQDSEAVLRKGLNTVLPYRLLLSGFNKYVQDLYETTKGELSKASGEEAAKKILLEVEKKMKFFLTILEQINAHIQTLKHNFFELYVHFVYDRENSLRKIQKEGTQKILKCVG